MALTRVSGQDSSYWPSLSGQGSSHSPLQVHKMALIDHGRWTGWLSLTMVDGQDGSH